MVRHVKYVEHPVLVLVLVLLGRSKTLTSITRIHTVTGAVAPRCTQQSSPCRVRRLARGTYLATKPQNVPRLPLPLLFLQVRHQTLQQNFFCYASLWSLTLAFHGL